MAKVINLPIQKRDPTQAEIVYLRGMLRLNTIDLAEHRKRLLGLQKEMKRLRRDKIGLKVVDGKDTGSGQTD